MLYLVAEIPACYIKTFTLSYFSLHLPLDHPICPFLIQFP